MCKNYWLHRISYEYATSKVLLEKRNLLSIGFGDFSDEETVDRIISNPDDLGNIFIENWGGEPPRNRFGLLNFITKMKKNDYVLVPQANTFDVYEIVGEKPFSNEKLDITDLEDLWGYTIYLDENNHLYRFDDEHKKINIDLGFYWSVKPIALNISRYDYADQALISRMKVRQTNVNIDDLEENLLSAIEASRKNEPINLHDLICKSTTNEILNLIHDKIDSSKFEELVSEYMISIGADSTEIPPKNNSSTEEGDADIIAYFESLKLVVLVQVKKHQGKTDEWAIEQIISFKKNNKISEDYTTVMWVISTCEDYSKDARDKAISGGVRLIDGKEFVKMLLEAGIKKITL